ncbi:hypothetical protein [Niallia taxi]|uniref:Uncharacterized protein n=1 Tax=Niallia taxi TaxID=2499688 RepID=A0A3S2U7F1_9BACI|nr:hypothetical protein [Niallia taxi]MCM3214250.1 hypothetical protein [Niallia taxi]MDK8640785.1 hypothetical protein [Niallia taxi]MED4040786.1 hypothetical protein [Niallia taxi]MED4052712.1 hypothetical protein [Niallia taxi]MED4120067.1 hypothetical protein [Niallia taxi]
MEWTLAILFGAALLLLIASTIRSRRTAKAEQREIDMIHLSVTEELTQLQTQVRNLELDIEIIEKETGVRLSSADRVKLREVLDLHRRKYSIESIAGQKKLPVEQVEKMLAPFMMEKDERRPVVNEA